MSRAEQYLNLAAEVRAKADREESPIIKADWEQLAEPYIKRRAIRHLEKASTYDPIQDMLNRAQPKKKR